MNTNAYVDRSLNDVDQNASKLRRRLLLALVLTIANAGVCIAGAPGPEPDEPVSSTATPSEATTRDHYSAPLPSISVMKPLPPRPVRPVLDPSARLLDGDDASEAWTLYIDLETGHRITQRFLLSNAGPGEHNAVAIGHLVEEGRAPYRYENGRRRPNWTLSDDRLFFDIAASHLDLHRPKGELRITKDDIEIRLFFDFAPQDPSARIPESRLPPGYQVEVLAVGAPTQGSIKAPWLAEPIETRGHTWLVHSWTNREESELLARRLEVFGHDNETSFYGIQMRGRGDWESAWSLVADPNKRIIESGINDSSRWNEGPGRAGSSDYPTPDRFEIRGERISGQITLESDWLRFDPLQVIPQPFRWFIRRKSKPQEVWADAQIGVRLWSTPETPSLPAAGKTLSVKTKEASRSQREIEDETAVRSVTGVASITFLNPMSRR